MVFLAGERKGGPPDSMGALDMDFDFFFWISFLAGSSKIPYFSCLGHRLERFIIPRYQVSKVIVVDAKIQRQTTFSLFSSTFYLSLSLLLVSR